MDFLNFFKKTNKINKVYLIVKITNYELFDEEFMPLPGVARVQPHWEYFPDKGVIKIDLNQEIVDFLNKQHLFKYTFDELFELKIFEEYLITIDKCLFKDFSELFIYIEYTLDNKPFINFYSQNDTIESLDFTTKNFKNNELNFIKAKLIINSIFLDITDYIKLFANNKNEVTQETMLLNYNIDAKLNEMFLKLI